VRVTGADWSRSGAAVDCRGRDVSPDAFAAAVRASGAVETADGRKLRVSAPTPGVVHEYVDAIRSGAKIALRPALAAAERTRPGTVDGVAALADAREALAAVEVPDVDVAGARERVAEAREAAEAVQADVAAARGAVQTREDLDGDVAAGRDRLRAAVAAASERETELVAAEQALARARERAREARDARSRRLVLEDRVGRLERDVRASRVRAAWPAFRAAVAAVPGGDETMTGSEPGSFAGDETMANSEPESFADDETMAGSEPGSFAGDGATAALAVARVADLSAPVVVAVDRFDAATDARRALDAPVVLASP